MTIPNAIDFPSLKPKSPPVATGGDFGFRLGKSIALGMVKPEIATPGQKLKIDILGKMYDCTILEESPYDPENNLLRA